MNKTITRAMTFCALAFVMAAGSATAQSGNACMYANDNVNSFDGPNTVDGYLVTADSQTYLPPVETGGDGVGDPSLARDIVVNPTKSIVYASDARTGDVAAMKIDPATCTLTLLGNYPVGRANSFGMGLAISPNGKWLYVTGISAKTLNLLEIRPNGSLSRVQQTLTLPANPSNMAITPDGGTLVLGSPGGLRGVNQALSYSIDPSTGMLTLVSTISTKNGVSGLAIDSQGTFVYAAEPNDELTIAVFKIGSGSTLTLEKIYSFAEASNDGGDALLSASGRYLYTPGEGFIATSAIRTLSGRVSYEGQISFTGALGFAISKNGALLFSGSDAHSGNLGMFSVSQDGSLTSLGTFPTRNDGIPAWVAAKTF